MRTQVLGTTRPLCDMASAAELFSGFRHAADPTAVQQLAALGMRDEPNISCIIAIHGQYLCLCGHRQDSNVS